MSKFIKTTAMLITWLSMGAAPATAEERFGIRAGASSDPDQFHVGAHVDAGPLTDSLWFRPNIEIGVGSNVTLVAVNVELAYKIPLKRQPWRLYVGGGPALNIYRRKGDTNPEGGFNIMLGAEHRHGLFAEVKAGLGDSPGIKVGVGYTFGR